jgi:hypothetical protein
MNNSILKKMWMPAAVAMVAVVIPAASSGSAAALPIGATTEVSAASIDASCRSHGRNYVVREYFRGPKKFTLSCGTSTWGWKHIKQRHGWNSAMDRKINAAISSGAPNGRGGYSTYTNQCPSVEKFRTIIGTPAGINNLLTAYKVDQTLVAATAPC